MQATSPDRRPGRLSLVLFVVIAVVLSAGAAAAITSTRSGTVATRASTTSTTEQHPSTTRPTVIPEPDQLDRVPDTASLLVALDALPLEPEHARSGYDRVLFKHWDDDDHDGCDTRCEVLASQRHADGTWLSEWDGYSAADESELEVDHIVALAEAWDSGADVWSRQQRDEFADDRTNLIAVTASENERKSDGDAGEWFPARAEANCLFASTVVRVKSKWSLSVDQREHDALANLLHTCPDDEEPTTTSTTTSTSTTTTTVSVPAPTAPSAPVVSAPADDCTPGYDPCIPPGDDVDCAGGKGNGPRYVSGPVTVSGSDPYGLDGDGDGVGCE